MNDLTKRQSVGPTLGMHRIFALDVMRGVAILGVLIAYTVWNLGSPPSDTWSAADRVVALMLDLFVDSKFITMFAFMFGLGVAQQWRRWEATTSSVIRLHFRRMIFLLVIGLLHAALLRNGDILAPYAILGVLLLAFRARSARSLLIIATALFLTPFAVRAAIPLLGLPFPDRPDPNTGSYLVDNFVWLRYWYQTNPFIVWPGVLEVMLMGLAAGRAQFMERLASDQRLATRSLWIAAPLAVCTWLTLAAVGTQWSGNGLTRGLTLVALYQLNALALAGAYATAILVLGHTPRVARFLWPLSSVGRMAFTNYLSQALLIVPFCLVFGLLD
ncbi:MAG: DUF418 domain-containing protein, partial [Gemmatimonadaceae bacterium]